MTWKINTLKDAIAPVFWFNYIFCMRIFEIPINRRRYLLTFIYITLITSGYLTLFYKAILIYIELFSNEMIIFYVVAVINILVAILCIILSWSNLKNVDDIIKRCDITYNTLEKLGFEKNYKKIYWTCSCYLITCLSCIIIIILLQILWTRDGFNIMTVIYTNIVFCFPLMINTVVDLSCASLIRCIQLKLQDINELMNNVVLSESITDIYRTCYQQQNTLIAVVRDNYKNNKGNIKHLLQTLKQLHLEITRIARLVNSAYCIQILLELAVHFTIILCISFTLYLILIGKSDYAERIYICIFWGLIYSVKVILINHLCSRTSNEAYKTGEIVQSFKGYFLDDEMREEIHQFTQQIILNPLNFTAAGFFTVDNAFTAKFFATVTTYLVILIQFSSQAR